MSAPIRTIKKYPNRRLYDTANSGYITLADVKQMVLVVLAIGSVITVLILRIPVSPDQALEIAGAAGRMKVFDFRFTLNEQYTFWSGLIGGTFLMLSYFGTDQSQVQRYLTAKSVDEARSSLLISAYWKIPLQAAILLVGVSRLIGRPLWLPVRIRRRALPAERLRPALERGLVWVRRLERLSRPHRLRGLVDGRLPAMLTNLAFILAALLLMAPFGLVPFSNTLPALALLLYAVGMVQRDGGAVLLGHLANIGTLVYFGALIGGGGLALGELWQRVSG